VLRRLVEITPQKGPAGDLKRGQCLFVIQDGGIETECVAYPLEGPKFALIVALNGDGERTTLGLRRKLKEKAPAPEGYWG
jgi:hypothetical protein